MTPTPTASPVAQDVAKAKYYRRGHREFYEVRTDRVIRVMNKMNYTQVTIVMHSPEFPAFMTSDAEDGQEITRDEFKEQLQVASRLIVLE